VLSHSPVTDSSGAHLFFQGPEPAMSAEDALPAIWDHTVRHRQTCPCLIYGKRARPPHITVVNFQVVKPIPVCTAWWQMHICVNYLPKVITWQCTGLESNRGYPGHQFDMVPLLYYVLKYSKQSGWVLFINKLCKNIENSGKKSEKVHCVVVSLKCHQQQIGYFAILLLLYFELQMK